MICWIREDICFALIDAYTIEHRNMCDGFDYETRHGTDIMGFYIGMSRDGKNFDKSCVDARQPLAPRGSNGSFGQDGEPMPGFSDEDAPSHRAVDELRSRTGLKKTTNRTALKTQIRFYCFVVAIVFIPGWQIATAQNPQRLEDRLTSESLEQLAAEARNRGNAQRGASQFFRTELNCVKCHLAPDGDQPQLGPELEKLGIETTTTHLIESLLNPASTIREGYSTITITDSAGRTLNHLLVRHTDNSITYRDADSGEVVEVSKDDIEDWSLSKLSIMPEGLVNQLKSKQEFLDLVKYLDEIARLGPKRALELRPLIISTPPPLPEYESRIDHRGLIASWDRASLTRGEQIYKLNCQSCHGTRKEFGSMPTSLRFAEGQFKRGSDPYSMYLTLTHGYAMMLPQHWMVPQQKYDVIYFIREAYLKEHNQSQYLSVNATYLAGLPKGDTRGPEPVDRRPWQQMNYGPSMMGTFEIGNDASNIAYKGIAIQLDDNPGGIGQGSHWVVYDHDTMRMAAAWCGRGFIDWRGINFDGQHNAHPRIVGRVYCENGNGPGWAKPGTDSFEDGRLIGRDQRRYGPLPRQWAQFKGISTYDNKTIIHYTVGQTRIAEFPWLQYVGSLPVFARSFEIGPRSTDLIVQVARDSNRKYEKMADRRAALLSAGSRKATASSPNLTGDQFDDRTERHVAILATEVESQPTELPYTLAVVGGGDERLKWQDSTNGELRLRIPTGTDTVRFTVYQTSFAERENGFRLVDKLNLTKKPAPFETMATGGPPRWPETLTTKVMTRFDQGPFAVDDLSHPDPNPWSCRMRFTGLDFFQDPDRCAVCSWDGTVYLVTGLNSQDGTLVWRRIASGLFQPLGLVIVNEKIFVTCRDQLVRLHDLNGDEEIDYYECFNNDHQITEHFHEFAMGLQIDDEGNFYYAKSARHAKPALVPHHGTLLRVSRDGERTDILAYGFRAANGVCLNPDGSFIVTDQEGHWNPKNRINWVRRGGFYGNMWGYHDITDTSDERMEKPLCWITNAFDRSPAELMWVQPPARWGPLNESLLSFSYGYGKVYVVPHETVDGQFQGGMCELPIPQFPTGVMRGRFSPADGQLYCCGMYAWSGNQTQSGGMYRIRYTGRPMHLPNHLRIKKNRIEIQFTGRLDPKAVDDLTHYSVKTWHIKRSAQYGSDHFNEAALEISLAELADDGATVHLNVDGLKPTRCMEIRYQLRSHDGQDFTGIIHSTVNRLGD